MDNPSHSLHNSQRRRAELIVSRLIQLCCHKELISSIHFKTAGLGVAGEPLHTLSFKHYIIYNVQLLTIIFLFHLIIS